MATAGIVDSCVCAVHQLWMIFKTHLLAQCGISLGLDMAQKEEKDSSRTPSNWKPWQTSSWYLGSLVVISALVAAILEYLVQKSNRPADSAHLLAQWLAWYTDTTRPESQHSLSFSFTQRPDACKHGVLAFTEVGDIPTGAYVLWIYFPSIFFVIFAIFWEIVDTEAKRVEPFYQASQKGGAKVRNTLFAEYIDLPSFLSPLQALYWRHWAILLCAINAVLLGTVTPILQSQMFQTQSQLLQVGYMTHTGQFTPLTRGYSHFPVDGSSLVGICNNDPNHLSTILWEDTQNNDPTTLTSGLIQNVVYLDPLLCRVQEAVLLAVAVSGAVFLWLCHSRQSGMKDSLRGFAVTASLCSADPKLLGLCRQVAAQSSTGDLEEELKGQTVYLGWKNLHETPYYGFWLIDDSNRPLRPQSRPQKFTRAFQERLQSVKFLSTFFGPVQHLKWTFRVGLFGFFILGLFTLLYGAIDKPTAVGEARFHDQPGSDPSKQGGSLIQSAPDLIISAFTKSIWKLAEKKTASYWIFRKAHLGRRKAWPVMARDYSSMPMGYVTVRAALDGQFILAFITFLSFLLEIAHICFGITASMFQGSGWTVNGILANQWIAAGVLVFICVSAPIWWRILLGGRGFPARFPKFSRDPGSLGMQIIFACESEQLLSELRPLARLDDSMRREYLEGFEYIYSNDKLLRA